MYKIEINDRGVVDALIRMAAFAENPHGALTAIGEIVTDFTKERFVESVDPYGDPWAANSDATLRKLLHGNDKNFTKKGSLSKRGSAVLAGKKPLIGESKDLSTKIYYRVEDNSVLIGSPMVYAAMQHFGGTKAEFPNLWGDIPARPIFPDESRGLPEQLNRDITDVLLAGLENAAKG